MPHSELIDDALHDLCDRFRNMDAPVSQTCDETAEDWGLHPGLLRRRFAARFGKAIEEFDPFGEDRATHRKVIRLMKDDKFIFSEWTLYMPVSSAADNEMLKVSGLLLMTRRRRLVTIRNYSDGIVRYFDEKCIERSGTVGEVFISQDDFEHQVREAHRNIGQVLATNCAYSPNKRDTSERAANDIRLASLEELHGAQNA